MFKTILIPLDGSALDERALPYALHVARGAGIRLLLLQAARDLALLTRLEAELDIAVRLEPHLDALRRSGAETTPGAAAPLSSSAIARVVREDDVDLIVMSIQGGVADDVLRRTPVPVLLVPPTCDCRWQERQSLRLLVPLDGSWRSEAALQPARELAATIRAELLLVRAVRAPGPEPYRRASNGQSGRMPVGNGSLTEAREYLETVSRAQGTAFASIDILVEPGQPARVIVDAAHARDSDVIAMAAHGGNGSEGHALGGVVTTVLGRADLPVLLAPLTALARPAAGHLATAARP